ncbi:DUF1996 domain-containing protein [Actinomadura violacea]|uniref:DUF1996 domain-containing protein n=1 Tax=Actinomadura violacea TaxID=2819934 RepID=A0ABS3RYJ1_9ACTN|nr:DUF1996 domain-containing protein [Actinomadura violacea]MBO2461827.1 DUF1996 domain-containing protein [Actinomadura violacea]
MGRKRRAFAVIVPAVVLAASACNEVPGDGSVAAQPAGHVQKYRAGHGAHTTPPTGGGQQNGGQQNGDGQNGDGQNGDGQMPGMGDGQMPGMGDPSQTAAPSPTDSGSPDPNQTDDPNQPGDDGQNQNGDGQNQNGGGQGDQNQVKPGPRADQFADIRQAPPVRQPRRMRAASTGVFTSNCGTNAGQKHSNPDNVIVAPGVQNGAHHIHDYVGNLDTSAFSTDQTLAAAGTTCTNGDQSTYYWPVVRLRAGKDGSDRAAQSQADGNTGSVVTPAKVRIQFLGNPRSKVTAIPRFTRIVTGDAKAASKGPANAHSQWTCSGFENRAFADKYPLCPQGSRVERVLNFPSCWDGQNTDSANHRDHMVFPDPRTGQCPQGRKAVPQLRITLAYNVPAKALAFALDTFPEEGHDPVTDHGDFINVMNDQLMRKAVTAINGRRR